MNLTKSTNSGVELVAKNRIFKIVNLTSSLNFFYNKLDSSLYQNPYDNTITSIIPVQQNFHGVVGLLRTILFSKQLSGNLQPIIRLHG